MGAMEARLGSKERMAAVALAVLVESRNKAKVACYTGDATPQTTLEVSGVELQGVNVVAGLHPEANKRWVDYGETLYPPQDRVTTSLSINTYLQSTLLTLNS